MLRSTCCVSRLDVDTFIERARVASHPFPAFEEMQREIASCKILDVLDIFLQDILPERILRQTRDLIFLS